MSESSPSPQPPTSGAPSAPAYAGFVHLRLHTAYSLLEGAIPIKKLPELARDHAMPALAVTDSSNLFGAFEVSAALIAGGIQPILGTTLRVDVRAVEGSDAGLKSDGKKVPSHPSVALLVQSKTGWQNLSLLVSKAYLETDASADPHIPLDILCAHTEGLICLTGGPEGPANRYFAGGHMAEGEAVLRRLHEAFGDRLYVELQRHGLAAEQRAEGPLIDWAYGNDVPLVATNEPYFATKDLYSAHDALICISEGTYVMEDDRRHLTPEHYFKSPAEMIALFADLPEAIENTLEIARRCAFNLEYRDPILPAYERDTSRSEAEELRAQASEGLKRRLAEKGMYTEEQRYWDRLDYELGVIENMGFPGYFLIVSDFMKWARAKEIPIGVRGSGATSIVAWSMDITNLDPLRFDLVFERFLNPERVSMPDFDIDFCQERRAEVIRYVQDKYGEDTVAQIITFGTLQARAVVRDVGRVLQMPYGQVDRICKMIPNPPGKAIPLKQAIADEPRLKRMIEDEESVQRLIDIALKLEGLYRHASTHAAGLVIGDRPLHEIVPLYRDPRADMPVTQFHYKDAEKVGLVKFDFLGLKTLTVIAKTEELLKRRGIEVRTQELDFDDPGTFEMLARGDSVGVFQLESAGMRKLLKQMRPDRIEDLIALVALYRPGPMDSIPTYIARKHGKEEVRYLHPILEPILKETFGVMTYQEDVMRVARDMAGYSLGEADLLRRAMGKKIEAEMEKQRVRFLEGASANGVPKDTADAVFAQAAKFAGYGFNKGHAAAYAQVAYQTAYLKANYPAEFFAASMTLDAERTDRLSVFRQEAERQGIRVLPPDVNRSEALFTCAEEPGGTWVIPYALAALRNVGRAAMDHVVAERRANGPYKDLFDFARRIDPRVVNKRALEGLAKAGAFDAFNANRAQVLASTDILMSLANVAAEERESNQVNLFGEAETADPRLPDVEPWSMLERLDHEHSVVGFYLSGHPLDDMAKALKRKHVVWASELTADGARRTSARLAGTVLSFSERKSAKTGRSFGVVMLSDPTGMLEAQIFSELLDKAREMMQPGTNVVVDAGVSMRINDEGVEEDLRLTISAIHRAEEFAADAAAQLTVSVEEGIDFSAVKACLNRGGRGEVTLRLELEPGLKAIEYKLPGKYTIDPKVRSALKSVPGVAYVEEL